MAEENKTVPEVADTAAAPPTQENSQVEKKHDVEYADEEAKGAVSTLLLMQRSEIRGKGFVSWLTLA